MRTILASVAAVVVTAWPSASTAEAGGDPRACSYNDARLAEACRTDPAVREYLLEPDGARAETYRDIPPAIRGWEPGEEEALRYLLHKQSLGCDFRDDRLVLACLTNEDVRHRLQTFGRGLDTPWEVLGPDLGGYAAEAPTPTYPDSDAAFIQEKADEFSRALAQYYGREVLVLKLRLVQTSGGNVIACGYMSVEEGQTMRSGPFIFDSSSGVIMPAAASLMRSRCSATGIVLR